MVFLKKKKNIVFGFFKKIKKINKYLTLALSSVFLIFLYKNTIQFKKFFYFFIKYNSYKKHKALINFIFFLFNRIHGHFFFKKKNSFLIQLKGRVSSKGSSKKRKVSLTKGSFYKNFKKCFFIDHKPSSGKQGCVNLKLILKIN